MTPTLATALISLVSAAAGGLVAWILRGKLAAAEGDSKAKAELAVLTERLAARETQIAERDARLADALREFKELQTEAARLHAQRAELEAVAVEQKKAADEKFALLKAEIERAQADLKDAFKSLSADALKNSNQSFLQLAATNFKTLEQAAKGDIQNLVKPLEDQLKAYQQRLQQSESQQTATLGEVRKQLETLSQQSRTLADETNQFRMVLKSNQARGKWGEETLRRVVEASGMSAHCDFLEQAQFGDAKPDMQINLPGDRVIFVDSKVPDFDFLAGLNEADAGRRKQLLGAHAAKLRDTIKQLSDRDYPAKTPNSLDYVVLFLPAESLFSAALEGDAELIVWAANRQVMLATPASLIAILRSISITWQQNAQTEHAREIVREAQEFYSRVITFSDHFAGIGDALRKSFEAYNAAVGSYQARVRPLGRKLTELGAGTAGKELPEITPIEGELRLLPRDGSVA